MRAAAIDIGTNSTRLLIAEVASDRSYRTLLRRAVVTRLGEAVSETHLLREDAICRTEEVLADYYREVHSFQAELVWVVATSAAREAKNCSDFVDRLRQKFNWNTEILSGEEEARLAFLGASQFLPAEKKVAIIDIGGGSTEIIVGKGRQMLSFCSLHIGSVRLTERFVKSEPPTESALVQMRLYIDQMLSLAPEEVRSARVSVGVGVAGTITTLSAIRQKMKVYDTERIHGSVLTLSDIQNIFDRLASLSLEERKQVVGLDPLRADVIVAGSLILIELLQAFSLTELTVSERDILDGILLSNVTGDK